MAARAPVNPESSTANETVSEAEIAETLQRIQSSQAFANSDKLLRFLEHVVAFRLSGNTGHLKETQIGLELFSRPADYDPKVDSIVRTQARRVRDRLKKYYESEGASDPIRLELHKGGYVPTFNRARVAVPIGADKSLATPQAEPPPRAIWRMIALGLMALILAFTVYIWRQSGEPISVSANSSSVAPARVAVLSFKSTQGGPEAALYGRALADSVISWLTQFEHINAVTPLDSSPDTQNSVASEVDAARRLNASYVVTGQFSKAVRDSKIWIRLSDVRSGHVLWRQSYSFQWSDLRRIEDAMGAATLRAVSAVAAGKPVSIHTLGKGRTAEAREAYLNGYYAALSAKQTFNLEAFLTGVRNLKRAIELEPGYSDAHAELADLYLLAIYPWQEENPQYLQDAEIHARVALDRVPGHAKSTSVLARIAIIRRSPLDALDLARAAVASEPGNMAVVARLGEAYEALGLYESAIEVYRQMIRRNPVMMDPYIFGAMLTARLQRFDEAAAFYKPFVTIDSESPHIAFSQGYIAGRKGDYSAAEAQFRPLRRRMMARLTGDSTAAHRYSYVDFGLALVEVRQGRKAFAREVLRRHGSVAARTLDDLTLLTIALGMNEEALRNLQLGYFQRNYRYLVTEPGLAPLYGDPGFKKLLEETYPEWLHIVAKTRASLPVPPPKLRTPVDFLAAQQAIRMASAE